MRKTSVMRPVLLATALTFCATISLLGSSSTSAQSGRRLPNSKPVATPTPEPEPTPVQPKEKPKPERSLVVGMDQGGGFISLPLQFYGIALHSCAERLGDSPSIKVVATRQDMSRGEAVKSAKGEKDTYVVWLQLRGDSMDADRRIDNVDEVFIEYVLLEPGTAKQITSGRAYQRAARRGGVIVTPPSSGRTTILQSEYLVKQAARDAAERILSALELPAGRETLP